MVLLQDKKVIQLEDINFNSRTNDVLKGKFKEKSHSTNAAIMEEPPNNESGDDITEERAFYTF